MHTCLAAAPRDAGRPCACESAADTGAGWPASALSHTPSFVRSRIPTRSSQYTTSIRESPLALSGRATSSDSCGQGPARTSRTGAASGAYAPVRGLHSTVSFCSEGSLEGPTTADTQHASGWSDTCSQRRRSPAPASSSTWREYLSRGIRVHCTVDVSIDMPGHVKRWRVPLDCRTRRGSKRAAGSCGLHRRGAGAPSRLSKNTRPPLSTGN